MDASKYEFAPSVEDFEHRVRTSFSQQQVMTLIGATLVTVVPGQVEIRIRFRPDLTQQHGFLHAGIITTIVDSACGYAAFTLMPSGAEVLTVEYKVNFIVPAKGEQFIARGKVIKSGRIISFCTGEVFAISEEELKLVATISATMMTIERRAETTGV